MNMDTTNRLAIKAMLQSFSSISYYVSSHCARYQNSMQCAVRSVYCVIETARNVDMVILAGFDWTLVVLVLSQV